MTISPYPLIGRMLAPIEAPNSDTLHMNTPPSRRHRQVARWMSCLLWVAIIPLLPAQTPPPAPAMAQVKLTPQELSQLLSPIALYPDALIALILPASTVPSDVVMGARYLAGSGDLSQVDVQPWDDSVKSLTRYPDVLSWMDQNLEWTSSLGEAFMDQPADVMNSIQALRAQARAAGTLVDTPQQKVVLEEEYIRIVPADPEIIYVPQYDPQIVYVQSYTPAIITFSMGFAVGSWLNYDFDWRQRCVYRGPWRGWNHGWNNQWRGGGRNSVNVVNIDTNNASQWRPGNASIRQLNQRQRNNNGNVRIVNARSQQPSPTAIASLPPGSQFDPGRSTAIPRPSRIDISNDRRNRPGQPNRPPATANLGNQAEREASTPGLTTQPPRNQGERSRRPQQPPNISALQPATTPPARNVAVNPSQPQERQDRQATPVNPTPRQDRPDRRQRFDNGPIVIDQNTQPQNRGNTAPSSPPVARPPRVSTPSTVPSATEQTPSRPERTSRPNTQPRSEPRVPRVQQTPQSPPRQQPQVQQPRVQPQQNIPQQVPQTRQQPPQRQAQEMRSQPPSSAGAQTQAPPNRGNSGFGSGEERRNR